mmetsp:Transcript_55880/g.130535  ORF Transcript_55880/g.130535 Transcript_55880/m.130535 type:complete len:96 (-) Transcript_55880:71-358(-)
MVVKDAVEVELVDKVTVLIVLVRDVEIVEVIVEEPLVVELRVVVVSDVSVMDVDKEIDVDVKEVVVQNDSGDCGSNSALPSLKPNGSTTWAQRSS